MSASVTAIAPTLGESSSSYRANDGTSGTAPTRAPAIYCSLESGTRRASQIPVCALFQEPGPRRNSGMSWGRLGCCDKNEARCCQDSVLVSSALDKLPLVVAFVDEMCGLTWRYWRVCTQQNTTTCCPVLATEETQRRKHDRRARARVRRGRIAFSIWPCSAQSRSACEYASRASRRHNRYILADRPCTYFTTPDMEET